MSIDHGRLASAQNIPGNSLVEALVIAQRAANAARCTSMAHALHADILLRLHRIHDARAVLTHALTLPDGDAAAYDSIAFVSIGVGDHEQGNRLYRRAVQLAPKNARFCYNAATSERSLGRLNAAQILCDQAIAADRHFYMAYLLRSELGRQSAADNHVRELLALLAEPTCSDRGRIAVGYALGKELDDLGRIDEAFIAWSNAATMRRRSMSYSVATDIQKIRRICEEFGPLSREVDAVSSASERFVFVVGLPRSGTTLVERILTGHAGVQSNGETNNFMHALSIGTPAGYGDIYTRAAAADPARVSEEYRRLALSFGDAVRVIEKLPLNYLYVGAIRRALPLAAVVWVKRDPVGTCFAMYRTLFADAYPFSYDLKDLADYHTAFSMLMEHWRKTLGDTLHVVEYEDLVCNPNDCGRQLAEACGLQWQKTATQIEKNPSASYTASASQIRKPIYQSSVGRWVTYERHLAPLIERLHTDAAPHF